MPKRTANTEESRCYNITLFLIRYIMRFMFLATTLKCHPDEQSPNWKAG